MVLCDADHSHHLVTKLTSSGAIPTVRHMPTWYAQGQLCLYLYLYLYLCFYLCHKGTDHLGKICCKCWDIWDMYTSVFISLCNVHVVYYRGQSRFHIYFRNQVDLRYNNSWHEISSSVTATVDKRRPSSSFGIATDYGLDGPGLNPSGDEIFSLSSPALGPTQPPVKWVPSLSQR